MNRPRSDEVHVYRAQVCPGLSPDDLDDVEVAAWGRLQSPADRDRYLSAHLLLRRVVTEHTGIAPAEQRYLRRCRVCGGPHGRPRLLPPALTGTSAHTDHAGGANLDEDDARWDTPHVGLSHAGEQVLVAIRDAGPVGVDIEQIATAAFDGFDEVALTDTERAELSRLPRRARDRARATWWVRKEATLKAVGVGLRVDPRHLEVSPPDTPPRLVGWTDPDQARPDVHLVDLDAPPGYAAALTALASPDPAADPVRVIVHP